MAFGGNVFEPEIPVEVAEEAEKRANAIAAEKTAREAADKELEPGPWTEVTLGPKVEQAGGEFQEVKARKENKSGDVRLRGVAQVKAGETLTAGEAIFTLPAGFRPPKLVTIRDNIEGAGAEELRIATTGVATAVANHAAGKELGFDGATFNIT